MSLNDRLEAVHRRQLDLVRELRASKDELAVAQSRVRLRVVDLERQADEAREHYREAVAELDPQAETLRDWPVRIEARIDELRAAEAEFETCEAGILERIQRAERDIEDFRLLQPLIVARVAAARSAGLGREVFETLSDALDYVEIALAAAAPDDLNGSLRPGERGASASDSDANSTEL